MIAYHQARRLALQGLACLDVQGEKALEMLDRFIADTRENLETVVYARQLMRDVFAARVELDELLSGQAQHWEVPRMAMVDRNILRLVAYEMTRTPLPATVAIDEAMKLATEFSSAQSARFINGVLDAVAKKVKDPGASGQEPEKSSL